MNEKINGTVSSVFHKNIERIFSFLIADKGDDVLMENLGMDFDFLVEN